MIKQLYTEVAAALANADAGLATIDLDKGQVDGFGNDTIEYPVALVRLAMGATTTVVVLRISFDSRPTFGTPSEQTNDMLSVADAVEEYMTTTGTETQGALELHELQQEERKDGIVTIKQVYQWEKK